MSIEKKFFFFSVLLLLRNYTKPPGGVEHFKQIFGCPKELLTHFGTKDTEEFVHRD